MLLQLLRLCRWMLSEELLPQKSFWMSLEKVVDRVDCMMQCFQLCFEVL